jgi:hypothetical protein
MLVCGGGIKTRMDESRVKQDKRQGQAVKAKDRGWGEQGGGGWEGRLIKDWDLDH